MNIEDITIVSRHSEYHVDNIYYYGPFVIGICFILLAWILAIILRKRKHVYPMFLASTISIFVGSILCSYRLASENMEVISTTYEFKTYSDEALMKIEMRYGKAPRYNKETGTYTVTI